MSAVYQFLGSGTKWLLRGSCQPLIVNHLVSMSNIPLNTRNIFVQILCSWRNLSSEAHLSVKEVSSPRTSCSGIPVLKTISLCGTHSSSSKIIPQTSLNLNSQLVTEEDSLSPENELEEFAETKFPPRKALDEIIIEESLENSSFIDEIGPLPPVSFNLAAYVNMSESLQQLVKLGVDLSAIEEKSSHGKFIQSLDFERDMKNHIQFLHDVGVPADELGMFLTRNPLIFKEDLDDLRIRINYLEVKKFSPEAVARIVTKSPAHLSLDTKTVDRRLGFLQKTFKLRGNEVRYVITKRPQLVPFKYEELMERIFTIKEELGFSGNEMKQLLLKKPKLYMLGVKSLRKRFNIVHNMMGIPHEHILHFPGILQTRDFKIEQRHKYLVKCGHAQYDPTLPNYVSLEDLSLLHDGEFCRKCAKTSLVEFNEFLKTL